MKSLLRTFALCTLIALTGCPAQTPPEKSKSTKADSVRGPVELKVVKLDEFKEAIKAEKGKVVVIDFWATWCGPCVAAFPHHVELHQKYRDKGVVCMSVSLDKSEDKDRALKFLQKQNADFPNFLPGDDDEIWLELWKIKGIPATMVYDQSGELHPLGNTSSEKVEHYVEKLLKK